MTATPVVPNPPTAQMVGEGGEGEGRRMQAWQSEMLREQFQELRGLTGHGARCGSWACGPAVQHFVTLPWLLSDH